MPEDDFQQVRMGLTETVKWYGEYLSLVYSNIIVINVLILYEGSPKLLLSFESL
jgi:hypothetical protein